MKMIRRVFDIKGTPILTAVFIVLCIAERRHQLRKRKQPTSKRAIINTTVAIPSFSLLRFLLLPVMVKLAMKNTQWKLGMNYRYNASRVIKGLAAFLMMDYTNYLWHILNHKVPFLWRFHLVHHCDPDLDVTTAFR